MDNKIACFFLENNTLYLDKALVEINGIPIFFICKNDGDQYYVVLCKDIDTQEYMIVKQPVGLIWKMLSQKISMRSLLLQTETFFKVKAGNDILDDQVEVLPTSKMDITALPFEGEKYEPITEDDKVYIDQILSIYLNSDASFYVIKGLECLCDFINKNGSFLDSSTHDSIQYSGIEPVQKKFSFDTISDMKESKSSEPYQREEQYTDNIYLQHDALLNNGSRLCLNKLMTEAA